MPSPRPEPPISTEGRELLLPRAIQSLFPLPFPQAKCDLSDWEDQENALWVLPLLKGPILWAHCQLPLPQKGGLAMASCVRVWVSKFSSGWLPERCIWLRFKPPSPAQLSSNEAGFDLQLAGSSSPISYPFSNLNLQFFAHRKKKKKILLLSWSNITIL